MPQKPPAKAPPNVAFEAVEARLLPPECSNSLWQGRREGFGGRLLPNVAFWSRLEKFLESAQTAAKASGEGAARQLKPGYCPQNGAKACGKGAARDLEAGYCLTSLSEATRKALGKRPECRKSLRRRRRGAVEARLLPPECSKSLWQGRREGFGGRLLPNVAFWSH